MWDGGTARCRGCVALGGQRQSGLRKPPVLRKVIRSPGQGWVLLSTAGNSTAQQWQIILQAHPPPATDPSASLNAGSPGMNGNEAQRTHLHLRPQLAMWAPTCRRRMPVIPLTSVPLAITWAPVQLRSRLYHPRPRQPICVSTYASHVCHKPCPLTFSTLKGTQGPQANQGLPHTMAWAS